MNKLIELLVSEIRKYKNVILTISGLVAGLIGLTGLMTNIFQSKINISIVCIGLFLLIKRVCNSVLTAKRQSFGLQVDTYPKNARKIASLVSIMSYSLFIYPIYIAGSALIYSRSQCKTSNHLGLLITQFALDGDDDFSYKLFDKLESEFQTIDTIEIGRSDRFIQSGMPHYLDSAKAIFALNCLNHGLLVFGKRNLQSKLFDCNILMNGLERLHMHSYQMINNNVIYVENPDLMNFSIESQASIVAEFIVGLLEYNNQHFAASRDKFKGSLRLNKNQDNTKFISYCYLFMGNSLLEEQRMDDAVSSYLKGLYYDSSNFYLKLNLANALYALSDTLEARSVYLGLKQSYPNFKPPMLLYINNKNNVGQKKPSNLNVNSRIKQRISKELEDVPQKQSSQTHFSGLHFIFEGGEYGLADSLGNIVIPCRYDSIYAREFIYRGKSYIIAMKDKKFGALNLKGEEEIPFNHPSAERVMAVIQILVESTGNN